MKVLILDRDTEYSKRLKYFLGKKYVHMQMAVCDNLEDAKRMMQSESYDVVLFDTFFDDVKFEELDASLERTAFAYISETEEIVNGKDTIVKFCGVSELYTKICSLYEKKRNRVVKQNKPEDVTEEKKTEIITFLPVHGGAGSSTMAAACAIDLASEYKVLYINLEQRPSDSVFFKGDGKYSVSDVISTMKTNYTEAGLLKTMNDIIQKDNKQRSANVSFIRGYSNIMDCLSMTEQSMGIFLNMIREKMDYKYIIIDADFIVSPVLGKLIGSSDRLVFVSSGSDVANTKLAKIQRYLDVLGRSDDFTMPTSYLLLNQYYGMNDELTVVRDMEIIARIARYRTDEKNRISSQDVIDVILSKKNVFSKLKPSGALHMEN